MRSQLAAVLRYIRHVSGAPESDGQGDAPLLERFIAGRDIEEGAELGHHDEINEDGGQGQTRAEAASNRSKSRQTHRIYWW